MKQSKLELFLSVGFISVFGLYPLIPERLESLSVILMTACGLIVFLKRKNLKITTQYAKPLITNGILFFFLLISALLSEDLSAGFKKIETMLSLLIIPLNFYYLLGSINFSKLRSYFFWIYYMSNIVFCIICIYGFNTYANVRYPIKDANFFRAMLVDNSIIGDHPIYISIFLSIAVLIGFTFIKSKSKNIWINGVILLSQVLIGFTLFLLMSKGIIIALLLSLIILFINNGKFKKRRVFTLISSGIILLFVLIPPQNNRFSQLIDIESYQDVDINNSTSVRLNVLKCSIDKIQASPFWGYGMGDVQKELDQCYLLNNFEFTLGKYNSHNQYLFLWLSGGILGVVIFIYFIIYFLKVATRARDFLMLSILMIYMIGFLFENILSRQSGVIFFSFIMNFLVVVNLNEQNKKV